MRKTNTNLLKSAVMFMIMAVMLIAASFTAYAGYDDNADFDEYAGYEEYTEDLCEMDEINFCEEDEQDVDTQSEYEDYGLTDDHDLINDFDLEIQHTEEPPLGSLVIINSTHDGHLLSGAVFAVYLVGDNTRIAELITESAGRSE